MSNESPPADPATPAHTPTLTDEDSAAPPATSAPAELDAHGHDPAAYDWVPVLRKPRRDGWSVEKQRLFIETLADMGSVKEAALAVGMTEQSAYQLRRSPGAEGFDRAWTAAVDAASKRLIDVAMQRAMIGYDDPVVDKEGNFLYMRPRLSERLLMFLLRAYMPERFAPTVQERGRAPADGGALTPLPVAQAIAAMLPAPPPDPAALLDPLELATDLDYARHLDGKLPIWARDPDLHPEVRTQVPVNEKLERMLEDSRRANNKKPPLTDEEWAERWAKLY